MIGALAAAALRWRVALLAAVAAALGLSTGTSPPDLQSFADGGAAILSGHFSTVYATPFTQAGPIQLVLSRLLMIGSSGAGPLRLVVAAVNVVLVLVAIWCSRRFTARLVDEQTAGAAHRELLVGGLVVFWLIPGFLWNGHPVEILVPVLWLVAVNVFGADRVGVGRWVAAGAALGVAAGITPWAVLGFPALLAAGRLIDAVRAGTVGVMLGVLIHLPFVLSGHFAMFSATWPVDHGTLVHLLVPSLAHPTWQFRLIQAAVVAGGTAGAAWALRGHRAAAPIAVLVAALLRVATDPVQLNYYWTSVAVVGIVILASTPHRRSAPWVIALGYTAWAGAASGYTLLAVTIGLALVWPISRQCARASRRTAWTGRRHQPASTPLLRHPGRT